MTRGATDPPRLVGRLAVDTEFGPFLGDTRVRLLEAIGRYGSIARAARSVPMSYKAAWEALEAMNNLAHAPLVESSVGGRRGGGTRLTDYGVRLVALYRALESEYQGAVDALAEGLTGAPVADLHGLMRGLSVRVSARNRFAGTVSQVRTDATSAEVTVRLDADTSIVAVVTRDSAETMDLRPGTPVQALFKASAVLLAIAPVPAVSARNRIWGRVSRVHPGPVNAELSIALPGGRTLAAVITRESLAQLDLAVGRPVCALIQAETVLLMTLA